MRIRRSVSRFFGASVIPAIALGIIAYFGYYAVSGTRGYHAYASVSADLAVQKQKLAEIHGRRISLASRIAHLEDGHVDPDEVQEEARKLMLMNGPGQV